MGGIRKITKKIERRKKRGRKSSRVIRTFSRNCRLSSLRVATSAEKGRKEAS
jgi:hypothetical protein